MATSRGRPFSFVETVQPVLDRHCVRCHGTGDEIDLTGTPWNRFTRSYWTLCGDAGWQKRIADPDLDGADLVPRFVMRNQIQVSPAGGRYGARGSRLMRLVLEGHGGAELSEDEIRRLAAWIDLNAVFYGVYEPDDQARQLRGRVVPMPELR